MKATIILDKRRERKDGKYPIALRIFNKSYLFLGTGYYGTDSTFKDGAFTKKESNFKLKNIALSDMLNQVEKLFISINGAITDKRLRDLINKEILNKEHREIPETVERYFVDYLDEFISRKQKEGTKTVYTTTRNKIYKYDPKATFDTIDKKWLESFEMWMAKSGMKINAYAIHLRNIRSVFNYAIDNEYTTLYPFRKFKIKKEETRKRSLSVEQLRVLKDYPCEEYQVRYRDMFMLMFYLIGVNAADLFLAKPEAIDNGRFEYKRAKTGKLYSIKVEPEAMEIIDRYKGENYLLNIMDEYKDYKNFLHRMGIALKDIGKVERVGRGGKKVREPLFKDLSSYWSRHTWATIAASIDIPKETISEALGHSIGSEVTSIYIKFDYKKVDEANRKVIDHVFKHDPNEE